MAAAIFPATFNREPISNLNLNINTGHISSQRVPFVVIKSFLSKLGNRNIIVSQNEGIIDMEDILADPPVVNRLLYFVPSDKSNIVNSCILCVLNLSMSEIVKQDMPLYNIYQGEYIIPATSKMQNVVKKSSITMFVKHEFMYTNVQASINISGKANKELYKMVTDYYGFSPIPGIKNVENAKLKKLAEKKLNDITQYLCKQLSTAQLSLDKGILFKCIQIAKAHCITRPLGRVIDRYFEAMWDWDMEKETTRRKYLSLVLKEMAQQTNAAIFELEHNVNNFLSTFLQDFINPRIISRSITNDTLFTIEGKVVRGVIFMPQVCFNYISHHTPFKSGILECDGKKVYFKPDDIFEKRTDKNIIEILHKEDINTKVAKTNDVKMGDILIGDKREQIGVIVKLTEAGKKLLESVNKNDGYSNSLEGDRKQYIMAEIKVHKLVTYYEYDNQVFPVEVLPSDAPNGYDSQWLMNTYMNYMGVVVWGGVNKDSLYLQTYGVSLENDFIINDKKLHAPDKLFTTKPVTVKHSSLNSPDLIFGAQEAIKVLVNPTQFSCKQIVCSINETCQRALQLVGENTAFIQSYFKEINETCLNYRKMYTEYIASITDDGKRSMRNKTLEKLCKIELHPFFSFYHGTVKNDDNDDVFYARYRYLNGNIPWFVIGETCRVLQGNKMMSTIKSIAYWKKVLKAIDDAIIYIQNRPTFHLKYKDLFKEDNTNDGSQRLNNAGFNESKPDFEIHEKDEAIFKEWYEKTDKDKENWNSINIKYFEDVENVDDTAGDGQKDTADDDKKGDASGAAKKDLDDKSKKLPDKEKKFISNLKNIAKSLGNTYIALFQKGDEYELNYLFVKSQSESTLWLIISHVILPVLTKGRMKYVNHDKVTVNTNTCYPYDNMLICDGDKYDEDGIIKDHVLSSNVSKMAMFSKYTQLTRMCSIFMMFNYNSPYAISSMVSNGIHTGFSIAYVRAEQVRAADIMVLEPDSISLIFGTGEEDITNMRSDGETTASKLCHMKYAPNSLGPAGLIAQGVFPIPDIDNNDRHRDGTPKISSDFITRNYYNTSQFTDDMFFKFNHKNKNIIDENFTHLTMNGMLPYKQDIETKAEYVPIICPAIDLNKAANNFPILGLERCPDYSDIGGNSGTHEFFGCNKAHESDNFYMSNLFSKGQICYTHGDVAIDKHISIGTYNYPKNSHTSTTTKLLEGMYNNMNESSVRLTCQEHAIITNFVDQLHQKDPITPIPFVGLPDHARYVYDHPNNRLANGILYSQFHPRFFFHKEYR